MRQKVVLSEKTFRGNNCIYLKTTAHGAMDLVGVYWQESENCWVAKLGDDSEIVASCKDDLRDLVELNIFEPVN